MGRSKRLRISNSRQQITLRPYVSACIDFHRKKPETGISGTRQKHPRCGLETRPSTDRRITRRHFQEKEKAPPKPENASLVKQKKSRIRKSSSNSANELLLLWPVKLLHLFRSAYNQPYSVLRFSWLSHQF